MSYGLAFTSDARKGWNELPVLLQEAALDELDHIAETIYSRARWIQELVVETRDFRYYVFFELRASASTRTLTVHRVDHAAVPL